MQHLPEIIGYGTASNAFALIQLKESLEYTIIKRRWIAIVLQNAVHQQVEHLSAMKYFAAIINSRIYR